MARDWASWLETATAPASATEEQERDRTEARIRQAIVDSGEFAEGDVRVYAKGSYAHRTNVRRDADVDIAVEWTRFAYVSVWGETADMGPEELGYRPASEDQIITPADLRGRIERAMRSAFPSRVDTTGRVAIKVEGAALPADVVPCFGLKRYDAVGVSVPGSRLFPTSGAWIDNFPRQHYDNGVTKNANTAGRYKKVVRCFKRLEADLTERGLMNAEVPGYVVECLLWNVPDHLFNQGRVIDDVRGCLIWLWNALVDPERYRDFVEVCRLVYLYRSGRHRPEDALAFVRSAFSEIDS